MEILGSKAQRHTSPNATPGKETGDHASARIAVNVYELVPSGLSLFSLAASRRAK
jgi:hypothetical protein